MRVHVVRSGGFAGIERRVELDTVSLPADQAAAAEAAVRGAIEQAGAPGVAARPAGADRFQYTLVLEDGGARRTIPLPESVGSAVFRTLAAYVDRPAQSGGGLTPALESADASTPLCW